MRQWMEALRMDAWKNRVQLRITGSCAALLAEAYETGVEPKIASVLGWSCAEPTEFLAVPISKEATADCSEQKAA